VSETFASSISGALGAVRASRGVAVTYWRGDTSLPITAAPASERYTVHDGDGVPQQVFMRDYLFAAADLDFGQGVVEPERGDRIKEQIGGVVKVFEVMPLGTEPAWRYMGAPQVAVRVHTKQVGAE